MKFTPISVVLLSVLCTACATSEDSILKAKGTAQNVEFASDSAQQGVVGFRATSVRISENDKTNIRAVCDLTGDGFAAKVNTPAVVNLPSYGKSTKPLQVDCLVRGKEHSLTVEPANLSADNRSANAVGASVLFGGVVGGAVAGATIDDKEGDAYGYRPIKIKLNY